MSAKSPTGQQTEEFTRIYVSLSEAVCVCVPVCIVCIVRTDFPPCVPHTPAINHTSAVDDMLTQFMLPGS